MSIEGFSLVEHFDYMKRSIPQPFFIPTNEVKEIVKADSELDYDYLIKTTKHNYTLSKNSLRKLVDSLGVKFKLLFSVCDETNVLDLALPIINKLFKCFSDCFVFYATSDDALTIIDLNVNNAKGEEGTRYEDGPSPWNDELKAKSELFTCFAGFFDKFEIADSDTDIQVKADSVFDNKISMLLYKPVTGSTLQPMLNFTGKFSNMNGFTEIHPSLFDENTGINIVFPMNYINKQSQMTFEVMLNKLKHIHETFDVNDYIFREMTELAQPESEAPNSIKSLISNIITDSVINMNQPIKDIFTECNTLANDMRPAKAKKFKNQIGNIIGWCVLMKHVGCSNCGHIHI